MISWVPEFKKSDGLDGEGKDFDQIFSPQIILPNRGNSYQEAHVILCWTVIPLTLFYITTTAAAFFFYLLRSSIGFDLFHHSDATFVHHSLQLIG